MIKQKIKIIRPLKAEDYPQWLPLWQLYVRVGQEAVPDDATQLTWQRIIAVPPVIHGLGYFADGRLLGFAHYHYQWNTWRKGGVIYLEDLLVASDARRQGIARCLIEHIYTLAEKAACERVFWKTEADNHAARALYRQLAQETDFVEYQKELVANK